MTGDGDGSPATSIPIPVKLGSASMTVFIHPEDQIEEQVVIRYKLYPWEPWNRWRTAWVHRVSVVPILERM